MARQPITSNGCKEPNPTNIAVDIALLNQRVAGLEETVEELSEFQVRVIKTASRITGAISVITVIGGTVLGIIYDKFFS